jgi:AraC-like DNA-binding protein
MRRDILMASFSSQALREFGSAKFFLTTMALSLILRQSREMATPMINKDALRIFVRHMERVAGARLTDRALRQAGLSRTLLRSGPDFLPFATEAIFAETVARGAGERHLGMKVGEAFRYRELGWVSSYVLAAPQLSGALARGRRALPLLHPGCAALLRDAGTHIVVSMNTRLHHVNGVQHLHEALPFLLVDFARRYLGAAWKPDWVEMTMGEGPRGMAAQEFPAEDVRYGSDAPGIALRKSELRTQNPDPLDRFALMGVNDLPGLMGLSPPETVTDEVLMMLRLQHLRGDLSAEAVAGRLATGVRSLQRSLQAEGTSFREVQQRFLKERATALLAETELPVGEVARVLGYREPDSFRRAFLKWTGMPPSQFARAMRGPIGTAANTA